MITFNKRPLRVASVLWLVGFLAASAGVSAETTADTTTVPSPSPEAGSGAGTNSETDSGQTSSYRSALLRDIKDYYTSPLRWDLKDWGFVAGAAALTAGAHHYDSQVRTHFIKQGVRPIGGSTYDLQDAAPTLAAIGGTWLYAGLIDSRQGRHETWDMFEAAGLSTVTSFALKYVGARQRPDQTSDPNKWRAGGSSFPSTHAAAAFAVGAVLAESGNDDYRWIRRVLGYGAIAGFTSYERLKHNAHWLSDDFAGAAIGGATARFILNRNTKHDDAMANSSLSVVPIEGGAMLTYNLELK
jgi:membrane-associated phospholipid phosphatase